MESVVLSRRFLHRVFIQFVFLVLLGSLKESNATSITFIEEPTDTSIVVGKAVSLNCTAVTSMKNETVKYSWQFKGKKITSTIDGRRTIKSDGTLQFTKTQVSDEGEYVCVAIVKPAVGDKDRVKSKKAVLTVQTICPAPTLTFNPDRSQHGIDSKIQMWCDCISNPPSPTVKWFKDGNLLTNGDRFSISGNGLVIDQLKTSDSGNYHCNASNAAGTTQSPVRDLKVIKAVRPSFEPKLSSQLFANKNENFKMECKATGVPLPTIKWFKGDNSNSLVNSSKLTLGSDGSLTISNVDDDDFDKYKCQARNFLGSIAAEVALSEAYINDIKFWRQKFYAEVGKQFTVSCEPRGGPKPAITWKTAEGGSLPASYVAKNENLINSNVKLSDSGNFTCVAVNKAGTKSANIQVIATEYPKFISEPKNTAANENGKAKLECSVKSDQIPVKITWHKNGMKVVPDSLHKINSNNALVFKKMTALDQGVYHCSVSSDIIDFDSRKVNLTMNAAIRLASYNMNHHKFNKGTEARVYCNFKGAGPITVTWKKMGKPLTNKNAVAKGQKLTISNIRMEDEGIYECTGSNLFSNASTKVEVSVYIYPKFVVKPNNITVEEFGSFWVHCNATGYPKPKITFSKETQGGDKLPPRFHQYENGSMYVNEILPEDKGNYYCIAANIANLLTTTFSLKVITPPGTKAGSKASTMGRTIAIAVGCAAAYIVLVVGLMIYCKRRRAKQQKKEQLTAIDGDVDNCEADPEMPLQPINGKPANYNKMEFPRHDLEALRTLGNGSYGRAFLARASGIKDGERETMVVVKSLMSKDDIQKEDFWRELNALIKMDSPHVVALLGVCRDIDPIYMIFEQLEKGDLKQYLMSCYENGRSTLTSSQKLSLCSNIVSGMTYLTSNNFVHKDVAARNCMVTKDLQVKIGFLSLGYDLYSSEYYRFNNILIPLRWMAPEAIFNDEFSEKSDVWSYGVLVWEIYTLGQTPFEDRSDEEVLKCIKEDLRLAKPDNCPDTMATIMNKCWDNSPDARPTFDKLYAEISEVAVDTHL